MNIQKLLLSMLLLIVTFQFSFSARAAGYDPFRGGDWIADVNRGPDLDQIFRDGISRQKERLLSYEVDGINLHREVGTVLGVFDYFQKIAPWDYGNPTFNVDYANRRIELVRPDSNSEKLTYLKSRADTMMRSILEGKYDDPFRLETKNYSRQFIEQHRVFVAEMYVNVSIPVLVSMFDFLESRWPNKPGSLVIANTLEGQIHNDPVGLALLYFNSYLPNIISLRPEQRSLIAELISDIKATRSPEFTDFAENTLSKYLRAAYANNSVRLLKAQNALTSLSNPIRAILSEQQRQSKFCGYILKKRK